ncbi:uncharacterized protein LOC105664535 [Ceratitis capitata]|uniref:uncharacterized protein LOC105664535 n=1 Tax=Ceratitis capitata TaxID=7213 RepID=UPI000618908D|nr:uncharacterized protein LOC105664535 [Ceratitis capitata]
MLYDLSKSTFVLIFLYILCLNYITSAVAYPWQANHEGYDASLDPVIWSRAFVKDNIRRTRQFPAFPPSTGENDDIQLNNRFYEFQQRFIDSNRAASGILRDETHRAENYLSQSRSTAVRPQHAWNSSIELAEPRTRSNRKSTLNRSKTQTRRKRNHMR